MQKSPIMSFGRSSSALLIRSSARRIFAGAVGSSHPSMLSRTTGQSRIRREQKTGQALPPAQIRRAPGSASAVRRPATSSHRRTQHEVISIEVIPIVPRRLHSLLLHQGGGHLLQLPASRTTSSTS